MNAPTRPALPPFHLAFFVDDLDRARAFYGELLGCPEGRSAPTWVDFDFFGHQLSLHLSSGEDPAREGVDGRNPVDGEAVPLPHFGVVLARADWDVLAARLQEAGMEFDIPPTVRFAGKTGEQATMFFMDPFRNALEIKGFDAADSLFRH